ncbi:MAG: hypothetical protein IPF99_38760 [Deltaproteobacteria bacterium]|nr:hypothetical protein [Deltaproteobacteria bacterium]
MEYGVFWSKALYKVGWAFFRMQNGYPEALQASRGCSTTTTTSAPRPARRATAPTPSSGSA